MDDAKTDKVTMDKATAIAVVLAVRTFQCGPAAAPLKTAWRQLAGDLLAVLCGLRPAFLLDYAPLPMGGTDVDPLSALLTQIAKTAPATRHAGLAVVRLATGTTLVASLPALTRLASCPPPLFVIPGPGPPRPATAAEAMAAAARLASMTRVFAEEAAARARAAAAWAALAAASQGLESVTQGLESVIEPLAVVGISDGAPPTLDLREACACRGPTAPPPGPTALGWMLGYPLVYCLDSHESMAQAARCLSAESLIRWAVSAPCPPLGTRDAPPAEICAWTAPQCVLETPFLLGEGGVATVGERVAAFRARLEAAAAAAAEVWGAVAMAAEASGPRSVAL